MKMRPGNTDHPWLHILQTAAAEAITSAQTELGKVLTDEQISEVIESSREAIVRTLLESLIKREKRHVKLVTGDFERFEKRNQMRWKPAFVALEALWQATHEIGAAVNSHERPGAVETNDYQFEAVMSLHAKTHLVAREAIALMRAGFPEGALARWRTMHEMACVALLLSSAPQLVAELYLISFRFDAYKAARQSYEFIPGNSKDHFTADEVEIFRLECQRLKATYGVNLADEYEWARTTMPQTMSVKRKINFRDIEEAAGQTWMRPYYKWASQHNHGAYRPADKGLGLCESDAPLLLTGQSNSGMVDPMQLVARTLAKTSEAMLRVRRTFDSVIHQEVIDRLAYRVAPIASEVERVTLAKTKRASRGPDVLTVGVPSSKK